jgi:hypothetical protein
MIFLFRSGSFRTKCYLVYKATRQHARNLGFFALVYKSAMILLRRASPTGKERRFDSFLAGLLGGYVVFSRDIQNPVSQQIVIYVFARVVLALAKLAVQRRGHGGHHGGHHHGHGHGHGHHHGHSQGLVPDQIKRELARNGWSAFAALSWASVMYVFRWHPETVQSSLRNSMSYMWVFFNAFPFDFMLTRERRYVQSDHWDSLRTLVWHNK